MFNYYRMSTIVGVLFAAGLMQLSRAEINDDQKIQYLETSLRDAKRRGMVPESGIDHFQAWDYWNDTTTEFKLNCAKHYEKALTEAGMDYNSEDKEKLAKRACQALDNFIYDSAQNAKAVRSPMNGAEACVAMMLGQYIQFSAILAQEFRLKSQLLINMVRQSDPERMSEMNDDDEILRKVAVYVNGVPP